MTDRLTKESAEITWAAMNDCECPVGGKHSGMIMLCGGDHACHCSKCGAYCDDVPAEVYDNL